MSGIRRVLQRIGQMMLENLHLKAIALLLSLVLFAVVRGDSDTEIGVLVPIAYKYPDTQVLVGQPPQQVRLTLAGRRSRLRSLMREGFDPVTVDLSGHKQGTYYFDEGLFALEPGVRLLAIQPARTNAIVLEPKRRRAVAVSPNLVGVSDPAFRLTEVAVLPRKVPLEGAQSVLSRIREIKTEPIDVDGRWESTELTVRLSRPDVPVTFDPNQTVTVKLSFEARYESRTFGNVPVEVINSTWQTASRPSQVRVTFEAPVRLLPGLNAASFRAVVDGSDLETKPAGSRHRLDVELEALPDTVRVTEIRPPRVLVKLVKRLQPERPEPAAGDVGPVEPGDLGASAPEDLGPAGVGKPTED